MKILLLFPPYWTPAMPHLALPALSSYLRSHGVEVIQRDLNLETFERVLTRDYLEQSLARLRQVARSETGHSGMGRAVARSETGHSGMGRQVARSVAGAATPPREKVRWALEAGPQLAAQVEQAVGVMRSPVFLDGPAGLQAFLTIVQSLEVASLPFYPAALDLLSYVPPAPVDSSRSLLQSVRDEQRNMFLDIFRRGILPDIVREQPDIVGISIPTEGQMLAGMTLAHLIKQAKLPCHVTVGGPHITMLREQLPRVPVLFKLIDSAVLFDGETPLLRLVETLDARGDLSQVPNLIWRDGAAVNDLRLKPQADTAKPAEAGSFSRTESASADFPSAGPNVACHSERVSETEYVAGSIQRRVSSPATDSSLDAPRGEKPGADPLRMTAEGGATLGTADSPYQTPVSTGGIAAGGPSGAFPLPDFDGLPLDRYLSPYLVLPLLTAHGCYHGKCAFCNVGYGQPGHFRPQPPDAVVEQMLSLRQKYGVRHIFFADEAMTPRSLRRMSARLEAEGSPIHWCGCVRFEKAFTQELLEQMAQGGCRMLLFGLETASERMIAHMVKGTERAVMGRVLEESTQAGIWNHTFFFFGFPTETLDDAQDTVNFVYAHGAAIHSASPGEFVLERDSPVHREPGKFGVRRIIQHPEKDLAIYFDYELESGLDEAMAKTVVERLLDVLPTKQNGQYYAQDVYRLLYASHLHDLGQPLPPWLMDEA